VTVTPELVVKRMRAPVEARSGTQAGVCDSVFDPHCRTLVGWNQSRVWLFQVDPEHAWTAPLDQSHV